MLPREKQKALIETILFISPTPVGMNQFLRKLRKANRRFDETQKNDSEVEIASDELSLVAEDNSESQSESEIVSTVIENDSDEIQDAVSETGLEEMLADNGLEESIELADIEGDAAQQLLNKSRELDDDIGKGDVKELLLEIQSDYNESGRGLEVVEVSKGWQIRTRYEFAAFLKDEVSEQLQRLSPSSLETLSIIAYQQPTGRHKIEEIRGVDTGGVLKTLLEKGFVRIIGRSEEPGKPLLYGTTSKFLEVFSLQSLSDLPSLKELEALQIETPMGETKTFDENSDNEYFAQDELSASEDLIAGGLSSEDNDILSELDASIKALTHVEKEIFPTVKPESEEILVEAAEAQDTSNELSDNAT